MERYNIFTTRMLVRCDEDGKFYLYDLVRTKKETIVELEYGRAVDYSEQFFQAVKNKKNLSHEDIINIQKSSVGKVKGGFQKAYYNIGLSYKGQIEKKNDKYICFQRIFIEGMYPDGMCSFSL